MTEKSNPVAQVANVNGVRLHFRATGDPDRPALVFANSLGSDFRIWDAVAAAFSDTYRIVRYDKRGHGLSDAPPPPYALTDHIGDLTGLLDRLQIADAIVCGLSVGGMIAQGLAAARPDLVRALILCDTGHKIGPPESWEERMTVIRESGIAALAGPILERWFSADYRKNRPDELAIWRHMLTRTPVDGYLGTCAAIRDADLTDSTRALTVPTLCICGSEDGATPPDLVRELADLIPGARFELIDGAGHQPGIEAPEAVIALMEGFLAEFP